MGSPLRNADANPVRRSRRRSTRPGTLAHLLRRLDRHPGRRGRQFEEICLWYLSNCRADIRQVWLWGDLPGRTGPDCGIDLVAERTTGKLIAVQAKALSPEHAIAKREIDSFLSESSQERFEGRLLIATTDRLGKHALRVIREQEKPVEFLGRSALGKESGAWPASPEELKATTAVSSLDLRRHQRLALDAAAESFGDGDRAQVVMACGSGKTLVAIKARERFGASRTLVVVPSLPLMKQTIMEWQKHSRALFGPVAHHLSFGEAIELGLLADYRVVVCVVSDADQLDLVRRRGLVSIGDSQVTDAASLATQVLVLRAMRRFALRRVLTFHNRVKRAAAFAGGLPGVADWLGGEAPAGALVACHVEGMMSAARRESALGRLENLGGGESALISNVRCLAEGVDVPSIDAVAIVDPKRSRSEIIQAVGRALRTNGEVGKTATVIVPAFVPKDQTAAQALRGSAFEPVWEVLSALRDQDERFADEVDALRLELGEERHREPSFKRLYLDLPAEVGAEFAAAFNARVAHEVGLTPQTQIRLGRAAPPKGDLQTVGRRGVDRGLDPLGLEALERFVRRTGHSRVPDGHKEDRFGLGDWFHGTLEAIERDAWGKPGRHFPDFEQLESFTKSVRSIDLDEEAFPELVSELDPMRSLVAFWGTVVDGRLPPELQTRRSVSADDFPQGDVWEPDSWEGEESPEALADLKYEGEWSAWREAYSFLMEQLQPRCHQEKFDAAMVGLSVLKEAEAVSETLDPKRRADFRTGVAEGIWEVAREGCLIDPVERRFRRNWDRINAYDRGWKFGKAHRQGPLRNVHPSVGGASTR